MLPAIYNALAPSAARPAMAAHDQERACSCRPCRAHLKRTDSDDLEKLSPASSAAGGFMCARPHGWQLDLVRLRLASWLGLGPAHRTSPRMALLTVLLLALALALAGVALGAVGWYYASIGWDDTMPTGLVDAAGQPAEYTLMFMSHAARRRTLRMSVEHYSKCPSGEAAAGAF